MIVHSIAEHWILSGVARDASSYTPPQIWFKPTVLNVLFQVFCQSIILVIIKFIKRWLERMLDLVPCTVLLSIYAYNHKFINRIVKNLKPMGHRKIPIADFNSAGITISDKTVLICDFKSITINFPFMQPVVFTSENYTQLINDKNLKSCKHQGNIMLPSVTSSRSAIHNYTCIIFQVGKWVQKRGGRRRIGRNRRPSFGKQETTVKHLTPEMENTLSLEACDDQLWCVTVDWVT